MYSRNITLPNTRGYSRGIRDNRTVGESERIPVRSFIDSSAYEHFGNIGKKSYSEAAGTNKNTENHSSEIIIENPEPEETTDTVSIPLKIPESAITYKKDELTDVSVSSEAAEQSEFIKPIISKLFNAFDTDIMILLAVAALLYFGKGNEKTALTPIALIAIAFL